MNLKLRTLDLAHNPALDLSRQGRSLFRFGARTRLRLRTGVPPFNRVPSLIVPCLFAIFLHLAGTGTTCAVQANVTLKTGHIRAVDVVSADKNGIWWKGGAFLSTRLLTYDQIAKIEFPEPYEWQEASAAFHRGEIDRAIAYYKAVANDTAANFFPAPGNYSSIAMLRLVECYKESGKFNRIAGISSRLTEASLPPHLRFHVPVIASWAEFGKGDFDRAAILAGAVKLAPGSSGAADLAFIKGRSLEKSGKTKEAIQTYALAYSVNFGSDTAISRRALVSSIRLLESLEIASRDPELHALVHTYARSFGNGELFPGASSRAQQLLAADLKIIETGEDESESDRDIITVNLREKKITRFGTKARAFEFEPPLTPPGEEPVNGIDLVKTVTIPEIGPGVDLVITALDPAAEPGIALDPASGLGVILGGQNRALGAMDREQGFNFTLQAEKGFRIAAITFGGGDVTHTWSKGDEATVEVIGLKPGEPEYEATKTFGGGTVRTFRRIGLKGGFLTPKAEFIIRNLTGSFAIDSIEIELEPDPKAEPEAEVSP